MKFKMVKFYMDIANRAAMLSDAKKLQVGTVIVKDDNIISFSWNGTPPNWHSNNCEYISNNELKTLPEVIHSEANAILKLAKTGISAKDSTLFCTVAPCIDCAKMIASAGISTVYYHNEYKNNNGLDFLFLCNVDVLKYENNESQKGFTAII